MASNGRKWTIIVSKFPSHVPTESVQDIIGQYKPLNWRYSPETGDAYATFKDESSAQLAVTTLNGRSFFGSRIVAKPYVAQEQAAFSFQQPMTPFAATTGYVFPPYNERIGAHILHCAARRPDFYNAVLLLMKQFGLPPPSPDSTTIASDLGPYSTAMPLPADGAPEPGLRMKRAADADLNALMSEADKDVNGAKKIKLRDESSEAEYATADVCEPPPQPLHLVPPKTTTSHHTTVLPLSVDFKQVPMKSDPNASQEKSNVDITVIPFPCESTNIPSLPLIKTFISDTELAENRLSLEKIKQMPRFESWEPGEPSSKLFVKNLASKVTEHELRHIFGRFSRDGTGNDIEIKLMKKGKMHGQAFVTLPDLEASKDVMQKVCGYLLHDRPIILEYGRSK